MVVVAVETDHEMDVRSLLDWSEEDKASLKNRVDVPLLPVLWDTLGEWVTPAARSYVKTGELPLAPRVGGEGEIDEERGAVVADLKGQSMTQRRARLSQALSAPLRSRLASCEVDDQEEIMLLAAQVDSLIMTLNVKQDSCVMGTRFDYSSPLGVLFGAKGMKVVATVMVALFLPRLFEKHAASLAKECGIQVFELQMLKELFL